MAQREFVDVFFHLFVAGEFGYRNYHPSAMIWMPEGDQNMSIEFNSITSGAAVERYPPADVPKDVRRSFVLWLTALAVGVVETTLAIITDDMVMIHAVQMLMMRLVIMGVLAAVIIQMRRGKNWARVILALLLGGIGTVSLVYGPIEWLMARNSLAALLQNANVTFMLFAFVRTVHLAAVLTALVYMFRPGANAYFRGAAR